MSEAPKDRARNPRRVPAPISFPRELTGDDLVKRRMSDDMWAAKNVGRSTIADRFIPGSQNPITEMLDAEEAAGRKRNAHGFRPQADND